MLFKDQSLEAIKRGIQYLKEHNLKMETEKLEKLINFYENYQLEDKYLEGYGFQNEDGGWIIERKNVNITAKVIEKISVLYRYPPERKILIEGKEDSWQQWIDFGHGEYDIAMKELERYTNLTHLNLFRPLIIDEIQSWRFYIETAFEPHFKNGNPLYPFAYSIPLKIDTESSNAKDQQEVEWLFLSKEHYFIHTNLGKQEADPSFPDMLNPFGILPVVESRRKIPVNQYGVSGAIDLVNANHAININLMNLDLIVLTQAFGIFYENSGTKKEEWANMKIAPNRVWHVPPDTTVESLQGNPDIAGCINAIKFNIELIEATYNIKINWSVEGTPASGFSLLVQNIDLLDDWQDSTAMMKMTERRIYKAVATMQQYYSNNNLIDPKEPRLDPDAPLSITYQEIDMPVEASAEIARIEHEYKWHKRTPIDDIMSDKGVDKDRATEIYEENRQLMRELSPVEELERALNEPEE